MTKYSAAFSNKDPLCPAAGFVFRCRRIKLNFERKGKILIRPVTHFTILFLVMLIFSFIGCTGAYYGKLRSTNQISGKELRQNWNDYTVYYQPYYALLFKINNDRKIVLSSRWVEVAKEDMVKNSTAFYLEDVREILGQNDELYGYLLYPSRDTAHVNLIDEKTVEVIYSRRIVRGE